MLNCVVRQLPGLMQVPLLVQWKVQFVVFGHFKKESYPCLYVHAHSIDMLLLFKSQTKSSLSSVNLKNIIDQLIFLPVG